MEDHGVDGDVVIVGSGRVATQGLREQRPDPGQEQHKSPTRAQDDP